MDLTKNVLDHVWIRIHNTALDYVIKRLSYIENYFQVVNPTNTATVLDFLTLEKYLEIKVMFFPKFYIFTIEIPPRLKGKSIIN
jgi:hypothetical protein